MKHFFLSVCLLMVVQGAMAFQGPVQDSLNVVNRKPVQHTLSINYDLGWITSKVADPMSSREYSWRTGQGVHAEYTCVFSKGMGFGLMGDHSFTDFPSSGITLDYIAPEFAMRGGKNKWQFCMAAGLGYAHYKDDYGYDAKSGIGAHYSIGAEYLLTRHIGVGADMFVVNTYFGKDKSGYYDYNAINRFSFLVGLRFHL